MLSTDTGMWLATRAQLKRFMESDYWTKAGALAADIGQADYMLVRGYYGGWCAGLGPLLMKPASALFQSKCPS